MSVVQYCVFRLLSAIHLALTADGLFRLHPEYALCCGLAAFLNIGCNLLCTVLHSNNFSKSRRKTRHLSLKNSCSYSVILINVTVMFFYCRTYIQYFLTLMLCTFCTRCILLCLVCIVVVVLCVLLSSYVYLLYCVCIAVFTLDAGLLARSQYSEGPATGQLDTGFS